MSEQVKTSFVELLGKCQVVDIPVPTRRHGAYVYLLVEGGEVVYVGKSTRLLARLGEHLHGGMSFDRILVIHLGDDAGDDLLCLVESALICAAKPRYNKVVSRGIEGVFLDRVLAAIRSGGDVADAVTRSCWGSLGDREVGHG